MRSLDENKKLTDYPDVLLNYDQTDLDEDDYVLMYDDDDFTVSRAATSKAISVEIDGTTYKFNVPSYIAFPIYVNATNTSKYYGFAGYRNAASATAYLGSRTFNAASGVLPTGSGDSEMTYSSITKSCGTYFNVDNTVSVAHGTGLVDYHFNRYGRNLVLTGSVGLSLEMPSTEYNMKGATINNNGQVEEQTTTFEYSRTNIGLKAGIRLGWFFM